MNTKRQIDLNIGTTNFIPTKCEWFGFKLELKKRLCFMFKIVWYTVFFRFGSNVNLLCIPWLMLTFNTFDICLCFAPQDKVVVTYHYLSNLSREKKTDFDHHGSKYHRF